MEVKFDEEKEARGYYWVPDDDELFLPGLLGF